MNPCPTFIVANGWNKIRMTIHRHEDCSRSCLCATCHENKCVASLEFACREPSCGALLPNETAVHRNDDACEYYYYQVDPNFFDAGYTLAGKTGFQVWTGARFLLETLLWPNNKMDGKRLQYWQESLVDMNILELGAGVGVVGMSLASMGANVLLTDLPTLVEHAVEPNLIRNATTTIYRKIHVPSG